MLTDSYIVKRCSDIEIILKDAAIWSSSNDKLAAHLAAYISVLIVGVLEDCIEYLVAQRVSKTQDAEMQNYVRKSLHLRFRNPDHNSISNLLKEFSDEYRLKFTNKIPHNGDQASALQSIVDDKNSLAHVGTSNLQMTISEVDNYYHRIVPILEALEKILI